MRPGATLTALAYGYNQGMIAGRQFSLASLFVATAFLAGACTAMRLGLSHDERAQFFGWFALPILLSGAIGSLRGRLIEWLFYGILFVFGITMIGAMAATFVRSFK
jgi:hypothetical protein